MHPAIQLLFCLLGGGVREHIFWKNYFFHCAYTRYEAGLSIDEIWSDALQIAKVMNDNKSTIAPLSAPLPMPPTMTDHEDEVEETITFAADDVSTQVKVEATSTAAGLFDQSSAPKTNETQTEADYELIDDDKLLLDTSLNTAGNIDVQTSTTDDADYELDELEAEIARELEN